MKSFWEEEEEEQEQKEQEGEKRGYDTFLAPVRLLCFGSGGEVIADSNHWGRLDMELHSAVGC